MDTNKTVFEFVRKQQWDKLTEYINDNDTLDTNIRDNNNNYLITYAILFNKIDIVTLLINKGAKLDAVDNDGRSLLYIVVKYNYLDILDLLLFFNKTYIGISLVDIIDNNRNIPLHYAIKNKNIEIIKKLLKAKSNIYIKDNNGNNSLHLSIYSRNVDICKLILDEKINVNSINNDGETALHMACNLELENIVKLLLQYGIDVNIRDNDNELTAISYCINRNNSYLTSLLLKNNADPNIQDFFGNSSIHYSIIEDNLEIFMLLINSKYTKNIINVNIFNADGKYPIHIALENKTNNLDDYLQFLLPRSNLTFQDSNGNCAMHYISKELWKDYTNILRKKKINIYLINNSNNRPIDNINKNDIEQFMDIIVDSYIYVLRNTPKIWKETWQNICKKELFYNQIEDKKLQYLLKNIKLNDNDKNNKTDICKKIVLSSLKSSSDYSYPSINEDIVVKEGIKVNFCTYIGVTLDVLIGLIYIRNKHKNVCTTLTEDFIRNTDLCQFYKQLGIMSGSGCEFLNFEMVWVYKKLYMATNFGEQFKKCIDGTKRFIIIPLGIELQEGSHSNYIIYDKKLNEIERFEPQGAYHPYKFYYDYVKLDKTLENRFSLLINNVKYIAPKDFLPKIGFQVLDSFETTCRKIGDPGGFCAIWALWYTDKRLTYPDIDRKELVETIIKNIRQYNISFKNIIRNYSINVTNIRDKILQKSNIDINDWFNNNYTQVQLNNIIKELKLLISN